MEERWKGAPGAMDTSDLGEALPLRAARPRTKKTFPEGSPVFHWLGLSPVIVVPH